MDWVKNKIRRQTKCLGFAWNLVHSERVSNNHFAPDGYPTNWGVTFNRSLKPDLPTSYPGWSGRAWIRYTDERFPTFGSNPFDITLTHTGTGGFVGYWKIVMEQELTYEIAYALPYGSICRYEQNTVAYGFLVKKKNAIYFKRLDAPKFRHQKKMWKICKWEYYSIASKEEYVLWKLENL